MKKQRLQPLNDNKNLTISYWNETKRMVDEASERFWRKRGKKLSTDFSFRRKN